MSVKPFVRTVVHNARRSKSQQFAWLKSKGLVKKVKLTTVYRTR